MNAYKNVTLDISYFGDANISPVLDLMWSDNANLSDIASVEATMNQLVRIPYTNAWRIGQINHDCFSCTVCKTYPKNCQSQKYDYDLLKSSNLSTCLMYLLRFQLHLALTVSRYQIC